MAIIDSSQGPNQQDENLSQTDKAQGQDQSSSTQSAQQQPASTPPTTAAGSSGVVSGGAVGGGASTSAGSSPDKPSTSGSWTNLNSYLSANQDQGAAIGNTIASTINNQGQNAQSEISNLDSGFTQAVQDNTVTQNQGAVNQAVQNAQNAQLTQADQQAFNQQATAKYTGPTDFTLASGYGQAAQDANTALNTYNQTQSEAGRDVLLKNQFNNASENGYNQGENNLDQLLLEGSGGADTLINAANQWTGLNGALTSDVANDNATAAAAAAQTQATAQAAQAAYTDANSTTDQAVQAYLANQQANYSTDYNSLVNALNAYNATGNLKLTAPQAQILGLTAGEQIGNLYQASPRLGSQYLSQAAFNNLAEVTPQQVAEMAALTQLGSGANLSADSFQSQFAGDTLAGTQTADNSINTKNFQTQVANAQTVLKNAENQNMTATGDGSAPVGYYVNVPNPSWNNPLGTKQVFIQTGTVGGHATDSASLASYLAANGGSSTIADTPDPNLLPSAILSDGVSLANIGGETSSAQGLADSEASNRATDNLWAAIQNQIATSGYNNQVNIS
jgi:hypothetical protein